MFRFPIFSVLFLTLCHSIAGQTGESYKKEITEHREEYKLDFLKNERSPLGKEDLSQLTFFEPDEKYKVKCTFEATSNAEPFDMATYSGITKPYVQYGWLSCPIDGKTHKLAVYQSLKLRIMPKFREYLFLPFMDLTNGETTYGGGRYIDLSISEIQGNRITIDFNKSYNPWCAYSDGYNCPIPPKENHLNIAVTAGEKNFEKKKSP